MSNAAKAEILARIRGALSVSPQEVPVPREYRRESSLGRAELIEMLQERLIDYKANVFRETRETLAMRIEVLLAGATRVVIPAGLDPALVSEELRTRAVVDSPEQPLGVRELNDTIAAVLTSSTVSCAETGTIFLSGRPEEGRRAISLVPDHHVCIVPVETIVELVPEALARVTPTAPITMISGPSATSDIELERVEGVHGPRRLDVIIVD